MTLRLLRGGEKVGPVFNLSRAYVALRDAPLEVERSHGRTFRWEARYVRPKVAWDREVFIGSLVVPSVDDRAAMERARTSVVGLKRDFDRLGLDFEGQRLVGVIRPPLSNKAFGVAVGVVEPTQQIRFTFDWATAKRLQDELEADRASRAVARIVQKPFIYSVNKDTESPRNICPET